MSDVVRTETRDGIAVVTLNRPEKRNALNLEMVQALHGVLEALEADAGLRACILTGGGDHFAAGADIAELRRRTAADALVSINGALMNRVENLPVPVIAAVRGFALGGGCELAIACDLRVAGTSARLGQPEVGLGIIPGAGATHRLPRLVGMGRAKELILTGRILDAQEALAMGLVNRVVDDAEVLDRARDMAAGIAEKGAQAVRLAKLVLNAQRHGLETGRTLESAAQAVLFESEDKKRRMTAFLEGKR
jgi:enoyl-CoA hydratase